MSDETTQKTESLDYFDEETAQKIEAGMRLRRRLEMFTSTATVEEAPTGAE